MSETAIERPGTALRVYQLALVLALGWLLGRLPSWTASLGEERGRLEQALNGPAPARPPAGRAADEAAIQRFEAEDEAMLLASRVAAEVAQMTVMRMVEAGWAPPGAPRAGAAPPQLVLVQPPAGRLGPAPAEQHVRLAHGAAPAGAGGWALPPAAPAQALERMPREERRGEPPAAAARDAPAGDEAMRRLAFEEASTGYAALRRGDRREGARQLQRALTRDPASPQAGQWAAELGRLTRRWSGSAWVVVREGLAADPLAATPVLGASQTGARAAFTPRPLDRRPLSVVARLSAGGTAQGQVDNATTEAALGLSWAPAPGVPLAVEAERRFAIGVLGRDDWAARIAGGLVAERRLAGRPWRIDSWAEAGGVGLDPVDWYGGLQARAGTPLFTLGRTAIDGGAGVWAAGQSGGPGRDAITRFDLGPSARFRVGQWPFSAQLDYRLAVAGTARPGSGPVITVSGDF